MGCAFRGWRRRFDNRHCGGALVWQVCFMRHGQETLTLTDSV
jgi:hypothetical protein